MSRYADMVEALCKPGYDIIMELDADKAHALHMAVPLNPSAPDIGTEPAQSKRRDASRAGAVGSETARLPFLSITR